MKKYEKQIKERNELINIVCDKCLKNIDKNSIKCDDGEICDFFSGVSVSVEAGYGSKFDGNTEIDLCDDCFSEIAKLLNYSEYIYNEKY